MACEVLFEPLPQLRHRAVMVGIVRPVELREEVTNASDRIQANLERSAVATMACVEPTHEASARSGALGVDGTSAIAPKRDARLLEASAGIEDTQVILACALDLLGREVNPAEE